MPKSSELPIFALFNNIAFMKVENYKPRICDSLLQRKLRTSGAVLITGPKWCGKTWTGLNAANSVIFLQDTDKRASYLKLAQTKPSLLLR